MQALIQFTVGIAKRSAQLTWLMLNHYPNLNPEKALIWRIVHRDNIPWLMENGVHCRNSDNQDPNYVNIGNTELIDKRAHRVVPIDPGGTLSDYVPFYFTPFSPMMFNIKTGYGGIISASASSSTHRGASRDHLP